ncbi:MAG: DUF3365 domain-containing protein [Phaeodactylibacter sp.]|nr:DUF3365 domain-containing protein [Phaeodactylibacter sp.]
MLRTSYIFLLYALSILALPACGEKPAPASGGASAQQQELNAEETAQYLARGKEVAMSTFAAMSSELLSAMQRGGVAEAARYCKLSAYPLVDSLSEAQGAAIRRTSLKIRNAKNRPGEAEKQMLQAFQSLHDAGQLIQPSVQLAGPDTAVFYAPIQVQPLCLQCHGKLGETMKASDYAFIKELYPGDEATGYAEGDLRGIWSIRFKR